MIKPNLLFRFRAAVAMWRAEKKQSENNKRYFVVAIGSKLVIMNNMEIKKLKKKRKIKRVVDGKTVVDTIRFIDTSCGMLEIESASVFSTSLSDNHFDASLRPVPSFLTHFRTFVKREFLTLKQKLK